MTSARRDMPVWSAKVDRSFFVGPALELAFIHQPVMMPTKLDQFEQTSPPSLTPGALYDAH